MCVHIHIYIHIVIILFLYQFYFFCFFEKRIEKYRWASKPMGGYGVF